MSRGLTRRDEYEQGHVEGVDDVVDGEKCSVVVVAVEYVAYYYEGDQNALQGVEVFISSVAGYLCHRFDFVV